MLLVAVAVAMATPAERWVPIGRIANLFEESLDTDSVKQTGDKVTLWTQRKYVSGDVIVWHEVEIDCLIRKAAILAYIKDDSGAVSHSETRPYKEASPISSGSVEEKLFDIACS